MRLHAPVSALVAAAMLWSCGTTPAAAPAARAAGGEADRPEAGAPASLGPVEVVEFHVTWNPACEMQRRVTEKLAAERIEGVTFRRVDAEASPAETAGLALEAYPAFVIRAAGAEVARLTGLQSADELRAAIEKARRGN